MKIKKKLTQHLLIFSSLYFIFLSKAYSDQEELVNLSVEDLLNIEVISVAKKAKSLNDSPAAIFVITQDDIKRIGATSIPEALRLAPGLDIARIDSNKWAVSSRGFNGRFANKLLVLIDGRNIYTRSFAGVYWENQDVMLEDVDRIEVIRGPGATLWGANAVNGVINIISKHSSDTQGGLIVAGGGTKEQGFGAFRYGGKLNPDATARAYIKGFKLDKNTHETGGAASDDWNKVQGGVRIDAQLTTQDTLTIQGDAYRSTINQNTLLPQLSPPHQNIFNESINTFGGNLLARQQHTLSSTSDYSVQVFYDFYERNEAFIKESRHVIDIDVQHRFALFNWNDIVWGAGYRFNHDDFSFTKHADITPSSRNDQLFSAFVQDELTLVEDKLWLTLGSKFEYNDYSGFELQPTARVIWAPHSHHRFWGAISRAVRTPSRIEHDISILHSVIPSQLPIKPSIALKLDSNQEQNSEQVISYEFGYRTTLLDNVSIDSTVFYNAYHDLRSTDSGASFFNPLTGTLEQAITFSNKFSAQTYGVEISAVWQLMDWWRWDATYSFLQTKFSSQGAKDATGISPQNRASLRSAVSPWKNFEFDMLFRYVDTNTSVSTFRKKVIKDYFSMDIRLAWQPIDKFEVSLIAQNLLAEKHIEYRQELFTTATAIERGMYGKITWRF